MIAEMIERADTLYDLVLKGGEVIDTISGIHGKRDIGTKNGRIAAVEKNLPE